MIITKTATGKTETIREIEKLPASDCSTYAMVE